MKWAVSQHLNPNSEHFGHTVAHWQQNIAKLWLTLPAARSGKASLAAYQCKPPSTDAGIGRIWWDSDGVSDCHPLSFVDWNVPSNDADEHPPSQSRVSQQRTWHLQRPLWFCHRRFLMWISWESRSELQQSELIGFGLFWILSAWSSTR